MRSGGLPVRLPHGRGFHEKAVSSQPKKFAVPGGLRGLAPWRSMRQRLMARKSAPMPLTGTGICFLPTLHLAPFPSSQ